LVFEERGNQSSRRKPGSKIVKLCSQWQSIRTGNIGMVLAIIFPVKSTLISFYFPWEKMKKIKEKRSLLESTRMKIYHHQVLNYC